MTSIHSLREGRAECLHDSAVGGEQHRPPDEVEQHQQEFPRLARLVRQYVALAVNATTSAV